MPRGYIVKLTKEILLIASLIPFKEYIKIRFTGKIWIVEYDGKKIYLRSSLLPKPEKPLKIRISRVGLWKRGYSKSVLRGIAEEFIDSLPENRSSCRFLLRLSKLRRRGLRYKIDRRRSEIAKAIGLITPKLIGNLMRKYKAKAYEIERKSSRLIGKISGGAKKIIKRIFKRPKEIVEFLIWRIYLF